MPSRFVAMIWTAPLWLTVSAAAAATFPSTLPNASNTPMLTGTDGYGMQFAMRRGHGCRLEMAFDGPALLAHLQTLKDRQMISPSLTPKMAEREPDLLSFTLAIRASAVALPRLARVPGATSCAVAATVDRTPLSPQGRHTLVSFTITSEQALGFTDHVPLLAELRMRSTTFVMSEHDLAGLALESDQAQATHAH